MHLLIGPDILAHLAKVGRSGDTHLHKHTPAAVSRGKENVGDTGGEGGYNQTCHKTSVLREAYEMHGRA